MYHVVRAPQHDECLGPLCRSPIEFSALESVAQRNGARWTRRRSSRWTRRRAHRSWSASGAAINRVFSGHRVRPAVLGSGGLPGRRGPCMGTESGRRDTAGATSGVRSTVWYVFMWYAWRVTCTCGGHVVPPASCSHVACCVRLTHTSWFRFCAMHACYH